MIIHNVFQHSFHIKSYHEDSVMKKCALANEQERLASLRCKK